MFKVFLADDEIVVREGIRNNFPWEETEFSLVGEASDGEMALSMLQDIRPDILITDIRMPFMDGLELCRALSVTMPWMYIIIISGHDDFTYAKEAISIGVKEYLLKPVSVQELRRVLARIGDVLRTEKLQQANLRIYRDQLASSNVLLKQKLLSDLLSGVPEPDIVKRARSLQTSLTAKRYLVMLIDPGQETAQAEDLRSAESVILRLTNSSGGAAYMCQLQGRFVLLVMGDDDTDVEERTYGLAQSVMYDIEQNTPLKPLVAIGTTVSALKSAPASYQDACSLLITMHESGESNRDRRIVGMLDIAPAESLSLMDVKMPRIYERVRHANLADVDDILSTFIDELGATAAKSKLLINYLFVDIVLVASRIVRDCGGVPQEVIPAAFQDEGKTAVTINVDETLALAREVLSKALEFRDEQGSGRYGMVLRKAKAFIGKHYFDPELTLRQVAGEVALSNNHFCTVFSQETGVTFTEYITALRIEKAKELLRDKQMRTSDVAASVGYNDPHYFSYLFKKYTDMSPRDFRKSDIS
ncbi:MAG: response regulator [Clostridiales bacterium]|nr:response regulator [Clostridiales bacterium]